MRCPQCNKFVSYGDGIVELEVHDQAGGEIQVDIRVVLPCADCSTELKENSFEWMISLAEHFDLTLKPSYGWGDVEILNGNKYHIIRAESPEEGWFVFFYEWGTERQHVEDTRPYSERHNGPLPAVYVPVLKYLNRKPAATQTACDVLLHDFVMDKFNESRFDVISEEGEFSENFTGKGRYMTTFYGADVTVKVRDTFTEKEHEFQTHMLKKEPEHFQRIAEKMLYTKSVGKYSIKIAPFGPGYEAEIYCEKTGMQAVAVGPTPLDAVREVFERLKEKEVAHTYIRHSEN